ncbi:LCP family protein [Mesorhizobium sp. NFR06]|uniref:LCP family glycopolymer transferase n=1 Tax=Mesorhizobium sp. NFR06 TaxID=1566290 RepID=UPI00122DB0F2|nr:LCP family protein [Mesorhizobium sp. NFR06]
MAAVVVAILDRDNWDANTDIIVVVDVSRRSLTWVPRDLWSPLISDRVNAAFAIGGGRLLLDALAELGFTAESAICLRRGATEAALADASVKVPIREPFDFWYPLTPTSRLEDGRRQVSFRPPTETLSGERLHQWIGARTTVDGKGTDFHRMRRQIAFLRALIAQGFDFRAALTDPELVRITGENPRPVLARVTAGWRMRVHDWVDDAIVDGKMVLVPRKPKPWWRRQLRRLRDRFKGKRS